MVLAERVGIFLLHAMLALPTVSTGPTWNKPASVINPLMPALLCPPKMVGLVLSKYSLIQYPNSAGYS